MKLSILTVNFNDRHGLMRTADSVLSQENLESLSVEWLVKDGGSTDGSIDYLEAHSHAIAWLDCSKDDGIFNAMNLVSKHATGDWLLYLNAGDSFPEKNTVQQCYNSLRSFSEPCVAVGAHIATWENGKTEQLKPAPTHANRHHFFSGTVNHQSAWIHREIFERFGPYDEKLRFCSDRHFFTRAVLAGVPVRPIPVTVARYDRGGLTSQKKHSAEMREEDRLIKKLYPLSYRIKRMIRSSFTSLS